MQRRILDFGRDAEGDWFVLFCCGHTRHVRHRPPFFNRPWVTTEAGRDAMRGERLDCVRCDRLELPGRAVANPRSAHFTEATIPDRLRQSHTTAEGVWGLLTIEYGVLRYVAPALELDCNLDAEHPGIVVPEVAHRVEPRGAVGFELQLYRAPRSLA